MPRTIADVFRDANENQLKQRQLRTQEENSQLDRAAKLAELQNSGFTVKQTPRSFFGGGDMTIERDPSLAQPRRGFVNICVKFEKDPDYVGPLDQAKIDLYKSKAGQSPQLTPGMQQARQRATDKIYSTVEGNQPRRLALEAAKESLPKVPQGMLGGMKTEWMKRFDPNNPVLGDWQKLKAVLTDAQLMNTAKTKGAISDAEMSLFAKAAANDDLVSISRMAPTLQKLGAYMDAEESGLMKAYQKNFNEDPHEWFQKEGAGNDAPSEEDIQYTMQKYGMTREQVLKEMGNG